MATHSGARARARGSAAHRDHTHPAGRDNGRRTDDKQDGTCWYPARAAALLLGPVILASACALDLDGQPPAAVDTDTAAAMVTAADMAPDMAAAVDNPTLERRCGVDLALVLDASSSVRQHDEAEDGNGAVDLVTGAARAFVNAFANTNSRIAVVSYNADPVAQLGLTDVSLASVAPGGAHDIAIGDPGGPTGPIPATTGYSEHARQGSGTNWEAGLATARSVMEGARFGVPWVIVHVTDGRPTRHLDPDGNVSSDGNTDTHIAEAATAADAVKAAGIHIFTVGIGRATSGYTANLQAVSGPDVYDQTAPDDVFDPADDDVILASDFDALQGLLSGIASGLCASSLTLTKLASTPAAPDTYAPAAGWRFVARPTAAGGYTWVLPGPEPAAEKTAASDASGRVQFQWNVRDAYAWDQGQIDITELPQDGFALEPEVACTRTDGPATDRNFTVMADTATGALQVAVPLGATVACELRNRALPPDDDDGDGDGDGGDDGDGDDGDDDGGDDDVCEPWPTVDVVPFVALWPPGMWRYTVTLDDCLDTVTDGCGNPLRASDYAGRIVSVSRTNPTRPIEGEYEIVDDTTVRFGRLFRPIPLGRTYAIDFTIADQHGNSTTATCNAGTVPGWGDVPDDDPDEDDDHDDPDDCPND